MIRHISFDLWMTLIRSHPQFKIKRAELIMEMFNLYGKSAEEIDSTIRNIDKAIDRKNMISGQKLSANKMYFEILKRILPKNQVISENEAILLRKESDILFSRYQPVFLNENIPTILRELKKDRYTINLSSNTGFIEGKTIRETLVSLEIHQYFDFLVFSDEINASKPSSHFFEIVKNNTSYKMEEIIHIGDNPKADYMGARNFGFQALLITDNNFSINDIRRAIQG